MTLTEKQKKEMLTQAADRIAIGRGIVRKRVPYLASALYGMIWQPTFEPGFKIGITDRLVCFYNPEWVLSEPAFQGNTKTEKEEALERIAGCVFHELWHPLHGFHRIHALKDRGMQEHQFDERFAFYLANLADDLSINHMARQAGFKLPHWVCYPENFDVPAGLLMEENWNHLVAQQESIQQHLQQCGFLPVGCGSDDLPGGSDEDPDIELAWVPGPGSGGCGSGLGTPQNKDEEDKMNQALGHHPAQIDRIRRNTLSAMKEYAQTHGRGRTPGFRDELFDFEKRKPLVRWESQLRHVLLRCSGNIVPGDDDYSMLRPDMHSALLGICLPSLIDQEPEVCFVRDTSGSMGEEQINHANNEIIHAMNALGLTQVWLLDADYHVQGRPRRVNVRDIPTARVHGRGGTSFVDAIEKVQKLNPRPDIVIYLTDGDGYAPEKKPRGMEVVWCIVPSPYRNTKPASWGHFIVCSNDRDTRQRFST